MGALRALDLEVTVNPLPQEVPNPMRCDEDDVHASYLHELAVNLDQCWDVLRQRRARREFGLDPGEAKVRDAAAVEHYQQ